MSEIMLRKSTESDKSLLADMVKDGHYGKNINFDRPDRMTVAEYDGIITGFMYTNAYDGGSYVMIYILPDYRRRGIGTALFNQAEKLAREAKSDTLWSEYQNIEESENFVNKLGYDELRAMINMKYSGGLIPEKDFLIRKYEDNDFDRYFYINENAWHELRLRTGDKDSKLNLSDEHREWLRKEARGYDNSFVLEDGGQVVALGSFNKDYIDAVCVDIALYNRGYGRAMTIFLTNEILRRGNEAAYLSVQKGNDNAHHIYKTVGYKETHTVYCPIKKLK